METVPPLIEHQRASQIQFEGKGITRIDSINLRRGVPFASMVNRLPGVSPNGESDRRTVRRVPERHLS